MDTKSKIFLFIILPVSAFFLTIIIYSKFAEVPKTSTFPIIPLATPSPTPFNPFPYQIPTVQEDHAYRTLLIGDSMTEALGVNANKLRLALISKFPEKEFVNYNYGFGSTNIVSVPDRLTKESLYNGTKYQSILTQKVELIIIESFAYNPLSNLSITEGLAKHNEILDETIKSLILAHPNTVIALLTPIAPNSKNFAKGVYDLTQAKRTEWINERLAYIQNHIAYAKEKGLPLINVYEKSLTASGDGDTKYINPSDNIHPSKVGIELIAETIAEFIFQNKIFPQ